MHHEQERIVERSLRENHLAKLPLTYEEEELCQDLP
jgi:hypothetical protein